MSVRDRKKPAEDVRLEFNIQLSRIALVTFIVIGRRSFEKKLECDFRNDLSYNLSTKKIKAEEK